MDMRYLQPGLCALLLAAGTGWAAWLVDGYRLEDVTAGGLGLAVAASLAAYMTSDRKDAALWLRFGLYGGALAVCMGSLWVGVVRPLQHAPSLGAAMAWLDRLDGVGLVLLAASGPAVVLLTVLWFEVAVASLRHLGGRERRRRAASDLHGHATLLGRRFLSRLAKRKGILLGQWSGRPRAPLIGWSLEGSAITVAPPRTGKGALIALNLLSPDRRGFGGSTVTVDPRGELWCIAARRRRELGRRVVLLDPFGVAKAHRDAFDDCHLPDVRSATYNPLEFIRDDDSLAVRDINMLLDALLTPPRPGAHDNTRHFYESARAIVAGYMAWVRFREAAHRRTLKTLHEMLSASPEAREGFAKAFRKEEPFAGGLARIAVERQAQVGREEGGSNFTTVANQLAFLNYPELLRNTARSTFDPSVLAEGNTDLFVVAPEETVEHVKGWLRLWVAIPNAVASRTPLERDMLIVIDEMPRIGFLKPVMDGYTMAAGKGVHFWCFAQSISALDSSWGKEHRRTLLHLAEIVQVLGFPRTDAEGAEELSKAIGTATFEGRTESRSGTVAESRIVTANTQWQAGESTSLVRERLVTPDELMTLGPDRQYVIAAAKDLPRDALHLHHACYWQRPDSDHLADPNPFVLRKREAERRDGGTAGRLVGHGRRPSREENRHEYEQPGNVEAESAPRGRRERRTGGQGGGRPPGGAGRDPGASGGHRRAPGRTEVSSGRAHQGGVRQAREGSGGGRRERGRDRKGGRPPGRGRPGLQGGGRRGGGAVGQAGQLPGGFREMGGRGPPKAATLEGRRVGGRRPGRPVARRARGTAVPVDPDTGFERGLERMDLGDPRTRHRRLRGRGEADGCRGGLCAGRAAAVTKERGGATTGETAITRLPEVMRLPELSKSVAVNV